MTMIMDINQICSVCGKSSSQPVLSSTNSFGYPDLDLRPPEMQRSTMDTWIYECPHCGYVSGNLENELEIPEEFLKTDEYMTCGGYGFKGKLASLFYKSYLIAKHANDIEKCFNSLLYCAWDCDDSEDDNAMTIRKLAIGYADKLIELDDESKNNLSLIKADLLRRSGNFDQLIEEYSDISIGDEVMDKVIQFQIEKAKHEDTACYTVEDVVGE